ncbi:glutathione S-transferase, amine-terminal domain protein (macronuclear) [Tetrahymena thermophila SB210]|uniref:glutathione transferase n=1 Tax=Tetrahymena thermophila (strain SB210) TaxID=312017 RepID=Q22A38_TETTS|nr:glutathione S-transferase, amine-terminal domain protein [Tetrahymena thermophila SB210]EAR82142.1 glutathione S-transferase, amine-terminal domain protein [Tetrahymena thermophila SB210]|eukprot:XP_001029805.1 glutathione S-transferase, amine-terminal domain protein [Tetrahymena thermophila SB210]
MSKIIIGQWASAGKLVPIKLLLELAGAQYEVVNYSKPDEWYAKDKLILGLPFPNLPYLIEGDIKLTETETIFDYLVYKLKKNDLLGQEKDKFIVGNIRNLFSDLYAKFSQFIQKQGDEKQQILNEQIIPKIKDIHKYLNKKDYLLGYFTVADLYLFPAALLLKQNLPQVYSEFASSFDPFLIRIQQIPQIAAYLSDNSKV